MQPQRGLMSLEEEDHLQLESAIGSIEQEERRMEEQKAELASRKARLAIRAKTVRNAKDTVVNRFPLAASFN